MSHIFHYQVQIKDLEKKEIGIYHISTSDSISSGDVILLKENSPLVEMLSDSRKILVGLRVKEKYAQGYVQNGKGENGLRKIMEEPIMLIAQTIYCFVVNDASRS